MRPLWTAEGAVASTAELVGNGASRATVARAARSGRLHRVGHGLYSATAEPNALVLAARFGTVSHTTAAGLLGFDLLDPPASM